MINVTFKVFTISGVRISLYILWGRGQGHRKICKLIISQGGTFFPQRMDFIGNLKIVSGNFCFSGQFCFIKSL
jgi:hypothetical protein